MTNDDKLGAGMRVFDLTVSMASMWPLDTPIRKPGEPRELRVADTRKTAAPSEKKILCRNCGEWIYVDFDCEEWRHERTDSEYCEKA